MTLMTNDGYFCIVKGFRKHTEVFGFFFLLVYLAGVKLFSLKEKDRWQIWSVFCSSLFCKKEWEMPNVFRFWSKERCLSCELTSLLQVFILELRDTKIKIQLLWKVGLSKEKKPKNAKYVTEEATGKAKYFSESYSRKQNT